MMASADTAAAKRTPSGIFARLESALADSRLAQSRVELEVAPLEELPPGAMTLVDAGALTIGVYNCAGKLHAIEDRCSHDDGPLAEGEFDSASCTVECPRHGSLFDSRTGKPRTLPAYRPVDTFEVRVDDDEVKLEL